MNSMKLTSLLAVWAATVAGCGGGAMGGGGGGQGASASGGGGSASAGSGGAGSGGLGSGGTGTGARGTGGALGGGGTGGVASGGVGGATATGGGGSGGAGGASGGLGTGPEPEVVAGCGTTKLYKTPDDLAMPGPWPVGVKTLQVPMGGATASVEIWYPAMRGSEAGKAKKTYDLTKWLGSDASKIPAASNKIAECNCYPDLPIDTAHGPYPGVIFIHGTGSLRVANGSTMSHWASRGFVVVAADHWGLYLSDFIMCPGRPASVAQDLSRDVDALIQGMTEKSGDFAFLGSSIDMTRIGIGGHSQGGQDAGKMGNKTNVQVVLPFAQLGSAAVTMSANTKSALFLCGKNDSVTMFSASQTAYTATKTAKKRLVGIALGNHMDVTDLCAEKNSQGKLAIQVAADNGVCNPLALVILAGLAQCGTMPDPTKGPAIANYVSVAALEETLHCQDRSAAFGSLKTKYPEVSDFMESQ
jgi:dienelactone hydrolase